MAGVQRQVGDLHTRADHGRLVAHRVDAVEQLGPLRHVAHIEPVHPLGGYGVRGVGLGDEGVHAHDLVTAGGQLGVDLRADEAARTGQQDLHAPGPGSSKGSVTSASQSAQPQEPTSSGRPATT